MPPTSWSSAAPPPQPPLPLWGDECRRLLREALASASASAASLPPASRLPQEASAQAGATTAGGSRGGSTAPGEGGAAAGGGGGVGVSSFDGEPGGGSAGGSPAERALQHREQPKREEGDEEEEENEEEENDDEEALLGNEGELQPSSSSSDSSSSSSSEYSDHDEGAGDYDEPADADADGAGGGPPPRGVPASSATSGEEAAAPGPGGAAGRGDGASAGRKQKARRGRGDGGRGRRRREARNYAGSVPCRPLPLPPRPRRGTPASQQPHQEPSQVALLVPSCLWMSAKQRRRRLGDRSAGEPPSADPPALWVARHADHEEPSDQDLAREILDLAERLSSSPPVPMPPPPPSPLPAGGGPYVIVWWMRSGRFAGGVFLRERCVAHSTQARYTTRRGQGGAQGAHDSSGSKAKSAGARLRRAGEARLWEDVRKVAVSWRSYFGAAALVFAWAPPVMQGTLFEKAFAGVVDRDDPRIRTQLPVTAGRPTFESLAALYNVLTACAVRPVENGASSSAASETHGAGAASSAAPDVKAPPRDRSEERGAGEDQVPCFPPLTALHRAAAAARVDELAALLEELRPSTGGGSEGESTSGVAAAGVNAAAGPLLQTPLHYAAAAAAAASAADPGVAGAAAAAGGESAAGVATAMVPPEPQAHDAEAEGPSAGAKAAAAAAAADARAKDAAECVYRLLVDGGADPALLDARRRVPYYLADSDEVRAAFRRARAAVGEESGRDWEAARVGPPLAEADEALRREREAERRRQKKQRQKERKAKDRAEAEAAALDLQRREDEARRQEEARRVRDGLAPKDGSRRTNACDYCQRVCAGLRRRDMYQRLEYAYCSTECVQRHKRELLASAALARFGGGGPSQQP